jgi:hypothetical protein
MCHSSTTGNDPCSNIIIMTKNSSKSPAKSASKKTVAKKTKQPASTIQRDTTWATVVVYAGSGMVSGYKLFVSDVEASQSYALMNPLVGEFWGGFNIAGSFPVTSVEESKKAFDDILGHHISGCATNEECIAAISSNAKAITDDIQRLANKYKRTQRHTSWKGLVKGSHALAVAKLQGIAVFSMSKYLYEKCFPLDFEHFYFLFETKEERTLFKQYVVTSLKIPVNEADDWIFWETAGGCEVVTLERVKEEVRNQEFGRWA